MQKFLVSQPPHIVAQDTTRTVMLDVLIALSFPLMAGIIIFGYRTLVIVAISVAAAVIFESLWTMSFKLPSSVWDMSAVVSGVILALNLPVGVPLWMPLVGSFFMIIFAKMCFGGLGQNFINPAAAGRAFLAACWPAAMNTFYEPFTKLSLISNYDVITAATPLAIGGGVSGGEMPSYISLYLGNIGGCMGETSALAILLGFLYLLLRRIISWEIPGVYILTVGVLAYLFGGNAFLTGDPLFHILTGGLLFGAVYMATDYTTSPMTRKGKLIFAVGLGVVTMIIRIAGGRREGVSYAILLMNSAVPIIDRLSSPKWLGSASKK